MEIDTFYQNNDMSFGFNGMSKLDSNGYAFAEHETGGFKDIDYSYANGVPNTSWGGDQQSAYKWRFTNWKTAYSRDCQKIAEYIKLAEDAIKKDKNDQATASTDRQRVLQRFIDGSQYALDEFKQMQKTANCTIAPTGGSGAITTTTTSESGLNATTWTLIIGSSVLLFGFVGFLIYKKYNK
tara:strand:- start:3814 stop:4359 length:546 start_codon:yes stop_codon:yes gene_type:complete